MNDFLGVGMQSEMVLLLVATHFRSLCEAWCFCWKQIQTVAIDPRSGQTSVAIVYWTIRAVVGDRFEAVHKITTAPKYLRFNFKPNGSIVLARDFMLVCNYTTFRFHPFAPDAHFAVCREKSTEKLKAVSKQSGSRDELEFPLFTVQPGRRKFPNAVDSSDWLLPVHTIAVKSKKCVSTCTVLEVTLVF